MNQKQKDIIINSVKELGLAGTRTILWGNIDIIRKAYMDNPESYMDYLIGNIYKESNPITDEIYFFYLPDKAYEPIFVCKRPDYEFKLNGMVYVSWFIWRRFYNNVMNFSDDETENIIKSWITKNIPDLSSLTPTNQKL
jgi:hypothetical protein